mgnify:CR=1 FL=1|tara:strand:- start:2140 stop:2775 length:636 start_codon:yes stop_codon:yes gene_type:complete
MLFILFFALFSSAYAAADYQVVNIYVDLTEVHDPQGKVGTSIPLNIMVAEEAQHSNMILNRMNRHTGAEVWNGEVNVYDWKNIQYMPTFKKCNYREAIKCGIQNNHWTLRTVVSVGEKFSIFSVYLYDERGQTIASSSQTAWGTIRWHPQWKLTNIKESGPYGEASKQVFEQWPARMEEIPPLITPKTISQAAFGFYWIKKNACRVKACKK